MDEARLRQQLLRRRLVEGDRVRREVLEDPDSLTDFLPTPRMDRQTLEIVETVGRQGNQPGEFLNPHNMAADSKENLFIADMGVQNGQAWSGRVQKLTYKGLSKP